MDDSGIILNLQRFSVHDGPGIRTLVFMKGCPLECLWCSNPESQKRGPELRLIRSRCTGCGKCFDVCPAGAIRIPEGGEILTDRQLCRACGKCVEVCVYEAREIAGKQTALEHLLEEVEKDRDFYLNSGGGVTVGGGEPACQHAFVRKFFKKCADRLLHTAVETCGHAPWQLLRQLLEYVDFIFYDIKHMDPEAHMRLTGVSNKLILENLQKIVAGNMKQQIVVRVPVITGLNDSEANIAATARLVAGLGGIRAMELLPYHRLGSYKYEQFGKTYALPNLTSPGEAHMSGLQQIVDSFGLGIGFEKG